MQGTNIIKSGGVLYLVGFTPYGKLTSAVNECVSCFSLSYALTTNENRRTYPGSSPDTRSIHFGNEVYTSQFSDDLPLVELAPLSDEIFASYSGPDDGLGFGLDNRATNSEGEVAGAPRWNIKAQKAYGICISLYEQHPVSGKMSGDPVADAFAICARGNNCVMLIADGVNWGEKSRLAARCALYGSMEYINHRVFTLRRHPSSTHEVFTVLRRSFDKAHAEIMDREGGLTTLCACMVCPVKKSGQYAVCCLNVGDSYGYIFSHNQGIREVTQGSHDVSLVRDIRDAGGAIGPVDGKNPELHNLTYGLSFGNQGDIVFLTTDGISDNYDPVVTKLAVAKHDQVKSDDEKQTENSDDETATSSASCINGKPEMEPTERHVYAMKEMERIVHEHELVTEEQVSAQDICSAMVQHVLLLTDQKRKVLENPELYRRKRLSQKEKQRRDSEIVSKMSESPGKLDHASIVSYEIGQWKPDEDEMDFIPLEGPHTSESDSSSHHSSSVDNSRLKSPMSPSSPSYVTSPSSSSKKIRPKKLFNKLRNNLSIGSSPNSPSSETGPESSHFVTAKRFSFKRSRTKSEPAVVTPTSPIQPSDFDDFRYARSPTSPVPMSPGIPTNGLPRPPQNPYRKSIAFESAV